VTRTRRYGTAVRVTDAAARDRGAVAPEARPDAPPLPLRACVCVCVCLRVHVLNTPVRVCMRLRVRVRVRVRARPRARVKAACTVGACAEDAWRAETRGLDARVHTCWGRRAAQADTHTSRRQAVERAVEEERAVESRVDRAHASPSLLEGRRLSEAPGFTRLWMRGVAPH
jgi:hypothetical protein